MKLEINLADREEIAAAVPLLQLILDGTATAQSAAPLPQAVPNTAVVAPLPIAPAVAPVSSTTSAPAIVPPAPMPALPVAAPTATDAAPMTPASGVEVDSKGLPWDERIHASTKTKVASGEWKAKRGVDAGLVASVEAELRAVSASPAAAVTATDAAAIFAGSPDPAAVFGGAVAPAPLPPAAIVPPAAPSVPAAPVAPSASADPTTFEQLMTTISPLVVAGKLPPTATNQAANAHGLANIVALQTAPQFVPLVWATIKQQNPAAFV